MALTRIVSSAVVFQTEYDVSFERLILSVTLGYLAAGLVMAAASVTVLRDRFIRAPRISVVFGVWIAAGLAMYVVSEEILGQAGSHEFTLAIALRFAFAFAAKLLAASAIVSYLLFSRAQVTQLRQAHSRHQQSVDNATPFLNDLRRRNLDALNVSLRPNLNLLLAEAQSAANNHGDVKELSDLPARIQSFGRNEVRTLSHRIAAGEDDIERRSLPTVEVEQPESWREALGDIVGNDPNPIVGGVFLLLLTVAWSNSLAFATITSSLLQAVALAGVLALGGWAYRVINPSTVKDRVVGSVMIYAAAMLTCAIVALRFDQLPSVPGSLPQADSTLPLPAQLVLTTAAFIVALLVTGANRRRKRISAQLSEADALLAEQIESMRRESNSVNQRIAQLLHGLGHQKIKPLVQV
jgi:multisubunit Na+/H+ antiporter MnhF subunit